ncbi:MAG: acyltransferase [Sedimenticola sp.]|nr:MAG: acyltransferase [Sedimenticola sp.]
MTESLMEQLSRLQLGESGDKIHLQYKDEHRLATQCLAQQSRRSLAIFTYDLDPYVYDQADFLDAVKQLAIASQLSKIRVLLQNNDRVQKQGHRLLEMARRLSSKIEIRRPKTDYLNYLENFLVVDATGYVKRGVYHRYDGEVCFACRLEAVKYENFFNEVWECSEPDSDLRRLYL